MNIVQKLLGVHVITHEKTRRRKKQSVKLRKSMFLASREPNMQNERVMNFRCVCPNKKETPMINSMSCSIVHRGLPNS